LYEIPRKSDGSQAVGCKIDGDRVRAESAHDFFSEFQSMVIQNSKEL
jgi:hypothetical protein